MGLDPVVARREKIVELLTKADEYRKEFAKGLSRCEEQSRGVKQTANSYLTHADMTKRRVEEGVLDQDALVTDLCVVGEFLKRWNVRRAYLREMRIDLEKVERNYLRVMDQLDAVVHGVGAESIEVHERVRVTPSSLNWRQASDA